MPRALAVAQPHLKWHSSTAAEFGSLLRVVPPGQKAQRGSAIYFEVSDIRAVYSSLKSNGVTFKAEPHVVNRTPQSELWLAEFTDPDGNQLALLCNIAVAVA